MTFVNPLDAFPAPNIRDLLLESYKGKHWKELPTPSFTVKESILDTNVKQMLKRTELMGAKLRAHVKTHKTIEGVKKQLGYEIEGYDGFKADSVIVSTFKEAWEIVNHQEKTKTNYVKDILFGLPNLTKDALYQFVLLTEKVENFILLVDSVEHIDAIHEYVKANNISKPWTVYVKLDAGTNRAGILDTQYLLSVIKRIQESRGVELFGFYVHAGHSYASKTVEEAEARFIDEIRTVKKGLDLLESEKLDFDLSKLYVSVGATPTILSLDHHLYTKHNDELAQLVSQLKSKLELHAGTYPFSDLQQIATGCLTLDNVSIAVTASVISKYPGRNDKVGEILINAGGLALSRETASSYPGFGLIITDDNEKYGKWLVSRLSQEHGILKPAEGSKAELIPLDTKVKIIPIHSCITANSYNVYFVLNDEDKVKNVWIPWRGW